MRKSIRVILSTLFCFELLFVLFMYAGRFKADPRFAWIPVDLTLLFFLLSVGSGFLIIAFTKKHRFSHSQMILFGLISAFFGYAIISLAWTPSRIYAQEKILQMATLTFGSFVATSLIVASQRSRLKRFLVILVLFSIWVVVESFVSAAQMQFQWTVAALGTNYLGLGRVIGIGALICLGYLLYFAPNNKARWLTGFAIITLLVMLLLLGGRAPFLATLFAGCVPVVVGVRRQPRVGVRRSVYILILLALAGILTYMLLNPTIGTSVTLSRVNRLITGIQDFDRLILWQSALEFWAEAPLSGHGVGAWPVLYYGIDIREYPHNIIFEILVEFGIIGLVLFLVSVIYSVLLLWRGGIARSPLRIILLMLFVNSFINALSTGDIPENRMLFASIGLMVFPLFEGVGARNTRQRASMQSGHLITRHYNASSTS